MVELQVLEQQLKKIKFNPNGWGRSEIRELCNILMPDEEVEECVNGYYEAGFALLVATKHRVLLVDKKPMHYLTVEDIRFDMISEFDYSHRLLGAHLSISSGYKTLNFTSSNQPRLRSLLTYVQTRMTEIKKEMQMQQENQQLHLEQMNQQLRHYLTSAQEQSLLHQKALLEQQQATEQTQLAAQQTQAAATVGLIAAAPTAAARLTSSQSFEQAAALSMNMADALPAPDQPAITAEAEQIEPEIETEPAPETELQSSATHRRIVLTPQQICLAAARRVVPIITAYSQLPKFSARPTFNRQDSAAGAA